VLPTVEGVVRQSTSGASPIHSHAVLHAIYLVRHGEVHNPDHLVYADLDGFGLSDVGRVQAQAAADRLAKSPADVIVASPLDRAIETAAPIATATGTDITTDHRLTEWALGLRWAGVRWDDLPARFPGELEAYLTHPADLAFTPETLAEVGARMEDAVDHLGSRFPGGSAVLVSHQDPIQALRLALTGRPLSDLQLDKPGHGWVITLAAMPVATAGLPSWNEVAAWAPPAESSPFPPVNSSRS